MQGYFRAYRNMMPTVISKVVEAAVGAAVTLGVGMAMSSRASGLDSVLKARYGAMGKRIWPSGRSNERDTVYGTDIFNQSAENP